MDSLIALLRNEETLIEGLLLFKDGKWLKVSKLLKKERLETFSENAHIIVSILNDPALRCLRSTINIGYIQRFNTAWTMAKLNMKVIAPCRNCEKVEFSSKSYTYSWLSNLFDTIVVDFEKFRASINLESLYVAFKVECFGSADCPENKELVGKIVTAKDGKKAKQLGDAFSRNTPAHDIMAVAEMKRLCILKFSQNLTLAEWLRESHSAALEEHTSDSFWGTANGTLYTTNSNHLGRILTEIRELRW